MFQDRMENTIDILEQEYFVGRDNEIECFKQFLAGQKKEKIINIYGTGGVGKSFLLDEFRRMSIGSNALYIEVDSRDFIHTPEGFCGHLLTYLHYPIVSNEKGLAQCLEALSQAGKNKKVILAIDTYEEIGELEHWFREHFFRRLSPDILVIISGRYQLQNSWLLSPAWRRLIYRMPLQDLEFPAFKEYLQKHEIADYLIFELWQRTKGHPLTMSLAAYNASQIGEMGIEENFFAGLVHLWLKEVTNEDLRNIVEAAAVLRQFNQDILSFVLGSEVQARDFSSLVSLSFIRRVKRGWILHDLVRSAISEELRIRTPGRYDLLWKRSVLYHYEKIMGQANQRDIEWESSEWFYYLGTNKIHAFFYQASSPHYFEPLAESNFSEAQAYINLRKSTANKDRVIFSTPDTAQQFQFMISPDENLMPLKHIDLDELYSLGPDIVKLLRSPEGMVVGLSAAIPINNKTIGYLIKSPLSGAYFRSLTKEQIKDLSVTENTKAGWFVKSIDIPRFEDNSLRAAAGLHFISLCLSGGFIVASPPPLPMFRDIHLSLGCSMAEGIFHTDYDGVTLTPTFVLDTRGPKLKEYLTKMLDYLEIKPDNNEKTPEVEPAEAVIWSMLTPREKEITVLVLEGLTNKEISARLHVSEITVKKAFFR